MPRKDRVPTVEVRRFKLRAGGVSEVHSVRYYDADGVRRRKSCAGRDEAEFERARLALEYRRAGRLTGPGESLTLGEFWLTWRADARGRLAESTMSDHEALWARRLEPRFGATRLCDVTPRMVSQWRAEMLAGGVGREAARKSMVL